MSVSAAPTIFDVFNARQKTPVQVAKSFIPPSHFHNLAKQTHSLVVGPRGSGKTTLLKMLHPAALESWEHPRADEFRHSINFTGVFIGTDRNWSEQVKALGDGLLDSETHRTIARAVFTTQILHSLVESMSIRAGRRGPAPVAEHRRVSITDDDENLICEELGAAWRLTAIPCFEALEISLSRRLLEIGTFASEEASRGPQGRGARLAASNLLHLDFLTAAGHGVDVFNARCSEPTARWALLFDELELAPRWITSLLLASLRSVDERFLFKLSMSPYDDGIRDAIPQSHGAASGQDYERIRLWYVHKEHGYPFCRDLLSGMLRERGLPDTAPDKILGVSTFSTRPNEHGNQGTAYEPLSGVGRMFKELAERDRSFRRYLGNRNIDVEHIDKVGSRKRASDLRKARAVVALRNYFKGEEGATLFAQRVQGRRSRKVPKVYGGADSLFAMLEGNPRWFIGIVGPLIERWRPGGRPIKPAAQVRRVLDAADVFRAMLNTIPVGTDRESSKGLLALLDPIGEHFARVAIDEDFNPDPPCSFNIDSGTSEDDVKALGNALNAGAIVYAPEDDSQAWLSTLRERRFRLSFILAPHYFIPLVLGRRMALTKILRAQKADRPPRAKYPSLFSPQEGVTA